MLFSPLLKKLFSEQQIKTETTLQLEYKDLTDINSVDKFRICLQIKQILKYYEQFKEFRYSYFFNSNL